MKRFRVRRIHGPVNGLHQRLRLLLELFDQRSEAVHLIRVNFFPEK